MGIFSSLKNGKKIVTQEAASSHLFQIDAKTSEKLRQLLLEMYLDLNKVCEKYQIELFLCGGSALGAVRHQGFIPWDDDLDMCMTRSDYRKLKRVFDKELSDKYFLKAPDYKDGSRSRFPKIMRKHTLFREADNCLPADQCCVFVDIILIENVPDTRLLRTLKGIVCNSMEFIGGQVDLYEQKSESMKLLLRSQGKLYYDIKYFIGFIFSFRSCRWWNRKIDRVIQYPAETGWCSLATGRKHYFGETLPRDVFFPSVRGEFEGVEVKLFHDTDRYLRNLYGDYMVIPEEKDRESHFVREINLDSIDGG